MPKDYVKYPYKPNRQLAEHGWRKRLLLVIIPIFLLSAIVYGFYIYKTHEADFAKLSISSWMTRMEAFISQPSAKPDANIPKTPIKEDNKQENEIQFDFYTELPNMQVTPSEPVNHDTVVSNENSRTLLKTPEQPNQKKELIKADDGTKKEQYVLQIAAFKNQTAAGEMRVSLLLAGHEVNIVKSNMGDQLIYLVQQGPYSNMAQVKSAQQELKQKGIDSVVKKAD